MSALSSFKRLSGQLMLGSRGELGYVTDWQTFQPDPDLVRGLASHTVQYLKEYQTNLDDHRFRIGLVYQSAQQKPWGSETLLFTDAVVRMLYPVSGTSLHELTAFQQKKRENSIHYGTELLLSFALKDSPGIPIFLPVLFDRGTTLGQYGDLLRNTLAKENPDAPVIEVLNLVGPATAARKNLDTFVALKEKLERTLVKKDARKSIEMKILESASGGAAAPSAPAAPAHAFTGATTAISGSALNTDANAKQWYNPALHDVTCEKLARLIVQPRAHAAVEDIRQFVRFRELTMGQQNELAAVCPIYMAPTNTVLLDRGTADQWNLYLLQGQVELVAADGEKKTIEAGTSNAQNAIAALKPRKFSATALTPVRFLWIHENIVAEIQQRQPGSKFELV